MSPSQRADDLAVAIDLRHRPGPTARVLSACVGMAGLISLIGWQLTTDPLVAGYGLPLLALLVAFAVSDASVLAVSKGRYTELFTLTEAPLVLGIVLIGPAETVLVRLLSCALFQLLRRPPLLKVLANVCLVTLECALVALLLQWAASDGIALDSTAGWPYVLFALLLGGLVGNTLVASLRSLYDNAPLRLGALLATLQSWAPPVLAQAVLVLLVLVSLDQPLELLIYAGSGLALIFFVRQTSQLRGRIRSLTLLRRFGDGLSEPVDTVDVATAVLDGACVVLQTDRAELLLLPGPDEQQVGWSYAAGTGVLVRRPTPVTRWLERSASLGQPVSLNPGTPRTDRVLSELGARNALAVPLYGGSSVTGFLAVLDISDHASSFTTETRELAVSLAGVASAGLEKARLLDRAQRASALREQQATHDELTGLLNRAAFLSALHGGLQQGSPGVLLLDVDRFRDVNDTLGHDVGDLLLLGVAERLRRWLRSRHDGAALARLAGDEFALLLPHLPDDALPEEARALLHVMDDPFTVRGASLDVRASVGGAARQHADDAGSLLQHADVAMRDAKTRGVSVALWTTGLDVVSRRRQALAGDLRRAVEDGAIEIVFQPKVGIATRAPVGVEALARWVSPGHGPVGPDEFIPLAERIGLIAPLTRHVLGQALGLARTWQDRGLPLTVAVNVSARGLADGSLLEDVPLLLAASGVDPGRLVLELTEDTALVDPVGSAKALDRLAALGVGLSIDDFGTGYSSLAYLARLPVHELKIDRSFVMVLGSDPGAATIVRSTIRLAHDLGLRVVAEGVEDEAALAFLRRLGCDVAQGYHLSRPLAADRLGEWLGAQLLATG